MAAAAGYRGAFAVDNRKALQRACEMSDKVFMVCLDEKVAAEFGDLLKRTASALSAVDTFSDKMTELDDDAPDLTAQVGPLLERLVLTLMNIYPNPRQLAADIKSIGDFKVRTK